MIARRTFHKSLLAAVTFAALAGSAGCTRWTVVRQAAPNPMNGATKFVLEPLHWENATVGGKTEAEYFSDKEPQQQQSYVTDKLETTALFVSQVKARGAVQWVVADPQAYIVRPIVEHWEPGFYAAVAHRDARMDLRVQILTPQGQVVDEFTTWAMAASTLTSPSTGGRMRTCGEDVGGVVGKYLTVRIGG